MQYSRITANCYEAHTVRKYVKYNKILQKIKAIICDKGMSQNFTAIESARERLKYTKFPQRLKY